MAGGTWASQNKVLPGVYINTRSQGSARASVGDKGIVAIAEPLSWGPSGVLREIIPGEDTTPYIGYDITHEKAMFLREMMKGSDVTAGPIKIRLYRLAGTGGAKAAAVIGDLTVTALYEGVRGNDISVIIAEDPDMEGSFIVSTVVDGAVADERSVTKISELKANSWVAFSGQGAESSEGSLTATAGQTLTGGVDPTVSPGDHAAFLTAVEPFRFDILVYDGTDKATIQAYAAFVERLSNRVGLKCQAVMAGASDCDSDRVISVNNGVKLSDGTILTPQRATWWLAGAEAGARYNQSLTYTRYPGAVEASPKKTDAEAEEAIRKGEIVFIDNFDTVKVCTDINTLTSFTPDKGQEYSKNRVIRVLDQFCYDAYRQFSLYYIGKTDNDDNGRNLLRGWIIGYLGEMMANGGIRDFEPDDVTVEQGDTVDSVLITVAIHPVDSVEKIYVNVTVSVSAETE
jgi:hypothetical protein